MCIHGHCRTLPDLPMLLIFDALPLNELLKIHHVCPTFAPLQTEALASRKVLTIFVGEYIDRKKELYQSTLFFDPQLDTHTTLEAEVELAQHSALELKTLDEEMVNWLGETFLRVTKLGIVFEPNSDFIYGLYIFIELLEDWAERLNTFGIWSGNKYSTSIFSRLFTTIFALINDKMHSLQYLTIALSVHREQMICFDLSFFGQLKRFSTSLNPMAMIDNLKICQPSLVNLPEIHLIGQSFDDDEFHAKLLEIPPRLAAKMTALNLDHISWEGGIAQMNAFFTRFSSLKWLSLSQSNLNINQFFTVLSQLPHLTYLELPNISFDFVKLIHSQKYLPPLSSLETLSISGGIFNYHYIDPFGPLHRLFPALKCINLDVYVLVAFGSNRISPKSRPKGIINCTKPYRRLIPTVTVSSIMRHLAQLGLKGSLIIGFLHAYVKYRDEFNFSDGGRFEDWQYDKEKEIKDEYHYYDYDSDF